MRDGRVEVRRSRGSRLTPTYGVGLVGWISLRIHQRAHEYIGAWLVAPLLETRDYRIATPLGCGARCTRVLPQPT